MSANRSELVLSAFASLCDFLVSMHPAKLHEIRGGEMKKFVKWSEKFSLPIRPGTKAPKGMPEKDQRAAMRACCIAMPEPMMRQMPPALLASFDALLAEELAGAAIVDALALEQQAPKVAIWQGDMSILKADAVVNPANSVLLGCFLPTHKCLDNILHGASGPRLRIACQEMKDDLNIGDDDNGQCRVTDAFSLPAKKVFHTVGPNLSEHNPYTGEPLLPRKPTPVDRAELTSCYSTCLNTASEMKLDSLAFCCISTGVFGYPSDEAAQIAMVTTKDWLAKAEEDGRHVPTVVFNVFLDKDLAVYHKNFPVVFGGNSEGEGQKETKTTSATTAGGGEEKKARETEEADENKPETKEKPDTKEAEVEEEEAPKTEGETPAIASAPSADGDLCFAEKKEYKKEDTPKKEEQGEATKDEKQAAI